MPDPNKKSSPTVSAADAGTTPAIRGACTGNVSLPVLRDAEQSGTTIKRSKMGKRRAAVLISVNVLMAIHVLQWQLTGKTVSPVEPSESMETFVEGVVNAGFIFFMVAIASTIVFGRFFCGWGCHLVALQDLCGWMMKKIRIHPKPFRSRLLVLFPLIIALYMFVWPNANRFLIAPLLDRINPAIMDRVGRMTPWPKNGLSQHIIVDDFWATFGSPIMAAPFLLVCGFATVYFLGSKGFCTYGCPYGGFFGPADLISVGRIKVDHDKCNSCGHCTAVCTSNVRVHEEIRAYGMVVDPGCMKCLDCTSVCPNDALSFGFGHPSSAKGKPRGKRPKRHFDLSLPEEIGVALVGIAAFFAVRGAYAAIAMLFAVGVACCVAFLTWKLWRVARRQNVRLIKWQLKRKGRLTRKGLVYVGAMVLLLVGVAHTGFVNYHRWRGDVLFKDTGVALQMLLDTPAQQRRTLLSDAQRTSAAAAIAHYEHAQGFLHGGVGLIDHPTLPIHLAALHAVMGDTPAAMQALDRTIPRVSSRDTGDVFLAYGKLLRDAGEPDQPWDYYQRIERERPMAWTVREALGQYFIQIGRAQDALDMSDRALTTIPDSWKTAQARARTQVTRYFALRALNRPDDAFNAAELAVELAPDDARSHETHAAALFIIKRDADGAIAALRTALRLEPDNAENWANLANVLGASGRTDDAAVALEEAARAQPNVPMRWFTLGQAKLTTGDANGAVEAFRTGLALMPDDQAVRREIAQLLRSAGLEDEAQSIEQPSSTPTP